MLQEQIYYYSLRYEYISSFFMTGFNFDNGGRRCIRPILEKYKSGNGRFYSLSFISTIFPFRKRWKWRIHREIKRKEFYDFKLSSGTDWIFLWSETRKSLLNQKIKVFMHFKIQFLLKQLAFYALEPHWKFETGLMMRKIKNLTTECLITGLMLNNYFVN